MNWANIAKKNTSEVNSSKVQKKNNDIELKKTEKKINIGTTSETISETKPIEYTSGDIFEFWYSSDIVDLLADMETYTNNYSFNILNNRKFKISYDLINVIKTNINLDTIPEYIQWNNKYEDLNDEEIISDENIY